MFYSYFKLREYYKSHKDYGLPFIPSHKERIKAMLELSQVKNGEKSIDLGAGDGRIVVAFALSGANSYGIEIDKTLVELARYNLRKNKVDKKANIILGDFWQENLGQYDIITFWGLRYIMGRFEEKIRDEAKIGSRILCNYFNIPTWQAVKVQNNVFLYIK